MKYVWPTVLLFVISLSRIGMGIYRGLAGPTILYLADNVSSDVKSVSMMFSSKSVGNVIGAISGGILAKCVGSNFRHMLVIGSALAAMAVIEFAIPWIARLWLLVSVAFLGGLMYGYLDSGMQALILKLWGFEASRPYIQMFHLMFTVGAFFAPMLASPFLNKAEENDPTIKLCPGKELYNKTENASETSLTITPVINEDLFNPTGWVYIIGAIILLFISVIMIILGLNNIEDKVKRSIGIIGYKKEDRKEESLRNVIWVFLPLIAFYFCFVGTENIFYYYTYAVSLCSGLHFSVTDASYMTSLVWLGLGVGRVVGIFASNYFQPRTIIIASIIGCILDSLVMSIFGEYTPEIAWIVAFSHGFTPAALYGSGVSWLSQITNVSGKYMYIFVIGNALSSFTMLPLAGFIFSNNPFSVMWLVFILAVLSAVTYALCLYAGKKHLSLCGKESNGRRKTQLRLL